jgi:UDP:flavonoid glycosyltransferase YjiC (YdhE family)
VAIGSRGDVQPYIALASGLRSAGYAVLLATHDEFEDWVRGHGLDFAAVAGSPRALLNTEDGRRWLESDGNPLTFTRQLYRLARSQSKQMMSQVAAACRSADLLLCSTLGLFSVPHVAEKYGIPWLPAPLQPLQPTRAFHNSIIPAPPGWLPFKGAYHQFSYDGARWLLWTFLGGLVNEARREVLDLPPTDSTVWGMGTTPLVLYGYSAHLAPRPPDWDARAVLCGQWFLDAPAAFEPPADLRAFLEAGAPPVYIGFGSMNTRDPAATAQIALDALAQTGQRGVLLTGWGGLHKGDLPDSIIAIDSIPHDWLFPRMAAVVHHGGVGTTAAGIRAGVPSILVPFFADQHFWGGRVATLGVGTPPIPRSQLTAVKLADAIRVAVSDGALRARAAALGARLGAEQGVTNAVEALARLLR